MRESASDKPRDPPLHPLPAWVRVLAAPGVVSRAEATGKPCVVLTEAPGAWAVRYGGPAGAFLLVLSQVAFVRGHVVPACGIFLLYFLIGVAYQRVHRWVLLLAWGLLAGFTHSAAGAIWLAAREGLTAAGYGHPANVAGGRAVLFGCVELYGALTLAGVALVFLEAVAQAHVEIKIKR